MKKYINSISGVSLVVMIILYGMAIFDFLIELNSDINILYLAVIVISIFIVMSKNETNKSE